jgi:CheY-like chemotaxis protein
MSESQLEDILKPFAQADSSTARKFGGTGLGLSISKALVELMGGTLSVTSAPDEGSEFSFSVVVETTAGDENADEAASGEIADRRYDGYTLLVVEDNEINQIIAETLLSEMGFSVELAENGRLGVEAFLSKSYDLIFMDIRMPVMDGLEASREIRKTEAQWASSGALGERPARVPIIAMTANAMREDRELSREAGMDGHISKPIDVYEIQSVLRGALPDPPIGG